MFISLEGLDYTGKSSLCVRLQQEFDDEGVRSEIVSDPPQSPPWGQLKALFEEENRLHRLAEAFVLLASRIDNYQKVIVPAQAAGRHVLSDRYNDSWLAYQSVRLAPHLGGQDAALTFLISIQDTLIDNGVMSLPDFTVLLLADPAVAQERSALRGSASKYDVLAFQQAVQDQYLRIAALYKNRIIAVDTRGKGLSDVYRDVVQLAHRKLISGQDTNK